MLEIIDKADQNVFLYFNEKYTHFSDQVWLAITNGTTWIPLYIILLFVIIKIFKKDSLWIIGGLVMVILASDQFTSTFMKPFFERLRPCHNPQLAQFVHVAKSCGGQFGFASSHAANTFGVAMFLWLLLKKYFPVVWILFAWSSLVSFSRVMIGVHYPGDILMGAFVGAVFGGIFYRITTALYFKKTRRTLIEN